MFEGFFEVNPDWRIVADLVVLAPNKDEFAEMFPDADRDVKDRCEELIYHTGITITRGTLYAKVFKANGSDKFAASLALQSFPRGMTDDVFFQGMPRLADSMPERQFKSLLRASKQHGFVPPADAVYQSGLARFFGDPEAYVTRSMGRTYIKRLCEKRGWACDGAVSVNHRQPEDDPLDEKHCVPLAEDIVRDNARRMIAKNPDLARMDRRELREKVIAEHGPSKNSLKAQ